MTSNSMSWKDLFKNGISSFKADDLESALEYFNRAIELDSNQHVVYDSRAAVYDKLGRPNDALRDAKKVIDIAPDQWQGYARSARVFLKVHKYDAALVTLELALDRLKLDDARRRVELASLKDQALRTRASAVDHENGVAFEAPYHFGKLPLELCVEIFREVTLSDPGQAVVLSHVSKHWRTVGLNTSMLWSTLVLSEKDPVRKVKEWAERSKGRIRELRIREGVTKDRKWSADALRCLCWNALRILRVETVDIFTYFHDNSLEHILSNLVELEASAIFSNRCVLSRCVLDGLSDTHLRHLVLDNMGNYMDIISSRFTQLASLVVRLPGVLYIPHKYSLAVLEANPTLEKLVLDFTSTSPPETLPRISLPHLTQLDLGGKGTVDEIFDHVSLPSLQKLKLFRGIDTHFWSGKAQQSEWLFLRELRIQSCHVNSPAFIDFLKTAPGLDTLEISYLANGANGVVEALAMPLPLLPIVAPSCNDSAAGPLSPKFLCPLLAHVNFSHCPDIRTGPLLRLVKSRLASLAASTEAVDGAGTQATPSLAQIESIVVDGCPQVEASALPWLRAKVRMVSCVYMSKKEARWKR